MTIEDFFARHDKIALQLSAGKDSAAVLWLLEAYWEKLDVVWMNPGDAYPETLAYMERVSQLVPHFYVILGNVVADIQANGWPVDILPFRSTRQGRAASSGQGPLFRLSYDCCLHNMWMPLDKFVKQRGYSGVIRGQKECDSLKNPARSGSIIGDVEYFYPIEDWNDQRVLDFLGEDRLPPSYKRGLASSLDCMRCTAYMQENPGRIADLRNIAPAIAYKVSLKHLHLADALAEHSEAIRNCHATV